MKSTLTSRWHCKTTLLSTCMYFTLQMFSCKGIEAKLRRVTILCIDILLHAFPINIVHCHKQHWPLFHLQSFSILHFYWTSQDNKTRHFCEVSLIYCFVNVCARIRVTKIYRLDMIIYPVPIIQCYLYKYPLTICIYSIQCTYYVLKIYWSSL